MKRVQITSVARSILKTYKGDVDAALPHFVHTVFDDMARALLVQVRDTEDKQPQRRPPRRTAAAADRAVIVGADATLATNKKGNDHEQHD